MRFRLSRTLRPLASLGLVVALSLTLPVAATAQAVTTAAKPAATTGVKAGAAEVAESSYKAVELATWVPPLRAPQRVIIHPTGVSFTAVFDGGPRAQKAEYLQTALNMMRVSTPPKVSQAVRLRYGPAEADTLVAYIEDTAAERLRKEIRPGEKREFFAFHVYNFSKGPALVITSFGPAL